MDENSFGLNLLRCPFCGSNKVYYDRDDASIYCNNCPGQVTDFTMSEKELFDSWNTRNGILKENNV